MNNYVRDLDDTYALDIRIEKTEGTPVKYNYEILAVDKYTGKCTDVQNMNFFQQFGLPIIPVKWNKISEFLFDLLQIPAERICGALQEDQMEGEWMRDYDGKGGVKLNQILKIEEYEEQGNETRLGLILYANQNADIEGTDGGIAIIKTSILEINEMNEDQFSEEVAEMTVLAGQWNASLVIDVDPDDYFADNRDNDDEGGAELWENMNRIDGPDDDFERIDDWGE